MTGGAKDDDVTGVTVPIQRRDERAILRADESPERKRTHLKTAINQTIFTGKRSKHEF